MSSLTPSTVRVLKGTHLQTARDVDVLKLVMTFPRGKVQETAVRELATERQADVLEVHTVPGRE